MHNLKRRDALIGVLIDDSASRGSIFALDCTSGALRRQVVRDIPPNGSVTGAVYDPVFSRYVIGINSGAQTE